jgi:DNA repair protein RadA/Sms
LALIIAVMEKKLGLSLGDQDIFINAVGGVKAREPAADLAVAAALLSSFRDAIMKERTLVFGEVGLAGEVRRVSRASSRIHEAIRLGFNRIVAPLSNVEPSSYPDGLVVVGISHIKELAGLTLEL